MSDADRDRIAAAAESTGRSLSEEIESRLIKVAQIEEEFGSGARLDLLRLIAMSLRFTERLAGSGYDTRAGLLEAKWTVEALLDRHIASLSSGAPNEAIVDALLKQQSVGRAGVDVIMSSVGPDEERDARSMMLVLKGLTRNHPEGLRGAMIEFLENDRHPHA